MAVHIKSPIVVKSAGNKIKLIEEFVGRVNSNTSEISIARMKSPSGWEEPAQTPEFDEYTFVIKGAVHVITKDKKYIVRENELFVANKGEIVQYSTPGHQGAEYIAVCLPAFSPETVKRNE